MLQNPRKRPQSERLRVLHGRLRRMPRALSDWTATASSRNEREARDAAPRPDDPRELQGDAVGLSEIRYVSIFVSRAIAFRTERQYRNEGKSLASRSILRAVANAPIPRRWISNSASASIHRAQALRSGNKSIPIFPPDRSRRRSRSNDGAGLQGFSGQQPQADRGKLAWSQFGRPHRENTAARCVRWLLRSRPRPGRTR